MIKKLIYLLFSIIFGLISSQNYTEIAFKKAIENGYINSPNLIPIIVNNKYIFTNSEALYFAAQEEIGKKDSESLKIWLFKNFVNQKLIFKNEKALDVLDFKNKKALNLQKIKEIQTVINSKHIIDGLKKLAFNIKENNKIANNFFKRRFALAKEIKLENPNFNASEIKFIDDLAGEFYSEEMKIEDLGQIADFKNSKDIFDLWKRRIVNEKTEYAKSKKQVNSLKKKFVDKFYKKYGNYYIVALFDYGILFFTSDLDGTTRFLGFAE